MPGPLSQEMVRTRIYEKSGGDILLSEYVNARTKLTIKCHLCSETYTVTLDNFNGKKDKDGTRCKCVSKAKQKAYSESVKKPFAEIKKAVEQDNYKLISENYINNNSDLEVECSQGHKYLTTWKKFGSGKRCKLCYENIRARDQKNK